MVDTEVQYDGREAVQLAFAILSAFFEGQSDAYWGNEKRAPNTFEGLSAKKAFSAYSYGFDTYHNPPTDVLPVDGSGQ